MGLVGTFGGDLLVFGLVATQSGGDGKSFEAAKTNTNGGP